MKNHRFSVILSYKNKKIDESTACLALGISPRTLKQTATLWSVERLRYIVPIVDRLMEPVNTKNDQKVLKDKLAELLDTTYRQVNRLLETSGIGVPPPVTTQVRVETHLKARERITGKQKAALDVIAGLADADYAAEMAATTRRHIYRLIGNMLRPHYLKAIDLRNMTAEQRKNLANQIEGDLNV